jgi:hypothetical protein
MDNLRLGDRLEWLINFITFGYGKKIAKFIAVNVFKKEDCDCESRKIWLNNLFKKPEDKIIEL